NFINNSRTIGFEPSRGLLLKIQLGYNNAQSGQQAFQPLAAQDPTKSPTGTAQFGTNTNKNIIAEPQISYENIIGKGKFSAMVGASLQNNTTDGIYILGSGYTSDILLRSVTNAPN